MAEDTGARSCELVCIEIEVPKGHTGMLEETISSSSETSISANAVDWELRRPMRFHLSREPCVQRDC
jgi:hypothetical protein